MQTADIRYEVVAVSTDALIKTTSGQTSTHGIVDNRKMYIYVLIIFVRDLARTFTNSFGGVKTFIFGFMISVCFSHLRVLC